MQLRAGPRCTALETREERPRQRVADARSKLVGLGAQTVDDPAASLLGAWAETFQLATLLGLPLWLELAAPVVLAYGFAPAPRAGAGAEEEGEEAQEEAAASEAAGPAFGQRRSLEEGICLKHPLWPCRAEGGLFAS